ncbi:MAG: heavy metal translocating P-type ATPase [Clostridia bacterium]|nr:heavy metal translocating P-type ATPase [Clostridia bacterium]
MKQFDITGMSCAACQTRIEKAVSAVDGVDTCTVNLLTNSMGVEGSASEEAIVAAVIKAGYGASPKAGAAGKNGPAVPAEDAADAETKKTMTRLIVSAVLLVPLMYVSMGHMMWNWPLPAFLEGNHVAMGLYQLLIAGCIMVVNQKFFINGFKGLLNRSPNMDTLVALGSAASFGYSVCALFAMSAAVLAGNQEEVMYYMDSFYFESAAMILTLITFGKMLEARSKGKTTNALKSLMKLAPQTAVLLVDGAEKEVPIGEVKVGDRFVVRPGAGIPVDGIVREGRSAVNEQALTGESIPVDKQAGDKVSAATINTSGYMVCEAQRVGEDTTLAAIIRMVGDAAATKAPVAKIADKVSGVFVPAVIAVSAVTFVVWMLVGQTVGYALTKAVAVLVISCPCALGLATPVAIMVGNGVAAKTGILFKTAASLEQVGKTQIVALDKTGTVTTGVMQVTDVLPESGCTEEALLRVAVSLEAKSEHPIAKAILAYPGAQNTRRMETENFETFAGNGLCATAEGQTIAGGNAAYIATVTGIGKRALEAKAEALANGGKTPVFFASQGKLLGIVAVADTIKEDSAAAVSELKALGIHVVLLTGDNERTANAIAANAGVDEVVAGVRPEGKEAVIRELMRHGKVAMVGDGINDAPALTAADTGIAIGAGTDIAIDAADVVLMKNSIRDVAAAVRISKATLKNIRENLFWAFIYNVIGIPLAAGCYVAAFGWSLNPMFGAATMGLSSFCVVSNALRLNLVKVYDDTKDKPVRHPVRGGLIAKTASAEIRETGKEDNTMKIKVNGMMCGHCEAHVKKALAALEGVESVTASHTENLVTLVTAKPVDEAAVKAAVEEAGYEYAGLAD